MIRKFIEFFIENICIRNRKKVKELHKKINTEYGRDLNNKLEWSKSFSKYINIGSDTALDLCECFYKIDLKIIKKSNILSKLTKNDPILICMVKNDIFRIKMIINYYRKIGIKLFVILDDKSIDGTREYLSSQPDVDLYESSYPYTTNIRQARINRLIDIYGFNRWYLIVDSDELFSYRGYESLAISDYISALDKKIVKSVMVDMYPKDSLFKKIDNYSQIEKIYKYYDNSYYFKKNLKGLFVYGGNRSKVFNDSSRKIEFTTSKNTLVYFVKGMIMSNSHGIFPYYYNFEMPSTVLRHYKFIYSDIEKFKERIKKQNFANNSLEYKSYINEYNSKKEISLFNDTSKEWNGTESVVSLIDSIGKEK